MAQTGFGANNLAVTTYLNRLSSLDDASLQRVMTGAQQVRHSVEYFRAIAQARTMARRSGLLGASEHLALAVRGAMVGRGVSELTIEALVTHGLVVLLGNRLDPATRALLDAAWSGAQFDGVRSTDA